MGRPRDIVMRFGTAGDAATLAALGARTFRAAYEDELAGPELETYIAEHYRPELQRAELEDSRVSYIVAEADGAMIGFAMVLPGAQHPTVTAERPIMLSQIYVDPARIGSGIGSMLMERCLAEAASRGHDVIWLGVWERNARAIAFYRRWQFAEVGDMEFDFAGLRQRDLVMARPILTKGSVGGGPAAP